MRSLGPRRSLSPEVILRAFSIGLFPMARDRRDRVVEWVAPSERGILPLHALHVPRRLKRVIRSRRFEIRYDGAFEQVIRACAESTPDRRNTWISRQIEQGFVALHRLGFAHSVEAWRDGCLVGGLYGVALGSAFFGESMFSRQSDASKVSLVHLVVRLRVGGFTLLDVQLVTEHLARFGVIEITAADYQLRLADALRRRAVFHSELCPEVEFPALEKVLTQSSTQMS